MVCGEFSVLMHLLFLLSRVSAVTQCYVWINLAIYILNEILLHFNFFLPSFNVEK